LAAALLAALVLFRDALPARPALVLGLFGWSLVLSTAGIWAAMAFRAGLSLLRQGSRFSGVSLAVMAALGMAVAVYGAGTLGRADLYWGLERMGWAGTTAVTLTPLADGRELLFRGYMDHGTAKALATASRTYPGVRLIRLDSVGGELQEAQWVRDIIAARGWDTHVSGACWSGCAIAFTGGKRRTLGTGGQLGFHSATLWPFGDEAKEHAINAGIARDMAERGVDPRFAREAWSTHPEGMWFPPHETLLRAGMVDAIVDR
jgi:hypothetical protein